MLQSIRDRTQGVFAWVVVIILVIIFVLWGLSSYLTSSQSSKNSVVATVDKQKIHKQEYNQVYQNAYQQQAQIHAGDINLVDTSEEVIRAQINILIGILCFFLAITPWASSLCIKFAIQNN